MLGPESPVGMVQQQECNGMNEQSVSGRVQDRMSYSTPSDSEQNEMQMSEVLGIGETRAQDVRENIYDTEFCREHE